ncbi:thermostable beta-glucosidase B [Plectosphaerella plurivora]|uniref:beta-glucosidase n=1 Tax=Plectosphaerella plurivora TaxID=936078 RepID=A0A9P9A8K2_9PEZI|nr:thermostable beta-glucosidase B [Plectosphaerella plurivora]
MGSAADIDYTTLLGELTLEEKIKLLSGIHFSAGGGAERFGIPPLHVADSTSGLRDHDINGENKTACFPNTTCYGTSWDSALLTRLGGELARQASVKGAQVILGPTINMHRDPRAGRNFECMSEDPLLSGQLAGAIVNGIKAQGHGVCPKHFVCNDSETVRHFYDVKESIDSRTVREIYLAAWQHLLRVSEPDGVMTAYNMVDGTYCSEHEPLIKRVLRGEWGFKGMTMSDWFGTHNTVEPIKAGLDLEMPFPVFRGGRLAEAVKSGAVTQEELDARVLKMLELRNRIRASLKHVEAGESKINKETNEIAWELATGGLVLLKNEGGALPLDIAAAKTPKLAVIGEYAKDPVVTGGGSASSTPQYKVPAIDLWRERVKGGESNVKYAAGVRTRRIVPLAPTTKLVSKSGKPGIDVVFFDDAVEGPVLEEQQEKAEVWMLGQFKDGVNVPGSRLQITTNLTPETSGEHTLAVRCTGAFELFVNDKQVLSGPKIEISTEQFIFNHILLEKQVQIPMEAGTSYSIRVEMCGPEKITRGEPTPYAASLGFEEAYDEEAAIAEAVAIARESDVSIIYAGRNEQYESEGYDLEDIRMPANQTALIKAVAAASAKTVIVMHAGNPIDVSAFVDDVDAVLLAHFPGQEGTRAIVDILSGNVSPSGKLATTWFKTIEDSPSFGNFPATKHDDGSFTIKYAEGIQVGYRHPERDDRVRWPFGFGLSYASFEYSGLKVSVDETGAVAKAKVEVEVKNTGAVAAKEVVQVYVSPNEGAAVWRPKRELKAFDKVLLQPGESKVVGFEIDVEMACSYWDEKEVKWRLEPGTYGVVVGGQSVPFDVTKGSVWNHV